MTTTNHSLQWFVIVHVLLRRYTLLKNSTINWVSGAVGLVGGLPDILSLPETIKGEYGPTYVFWHDFSLWSFVPPIGFHQLLDWLSHDQVAGGWQTWAYFAEPIIAFAIVVYFWYEFGAAWAWAIASAFAATYLVGLIIALL